MARVYFGFSNEAHERVRLAEGARYASQRGNKIDGPASTKGIKDNSLAAVGSHQAFYVGSGEPFDIGIPSVNRQILAIPECQSKPIGFGIFPSH